MALRAATSGERNWSVNGTSDSGKGPRPATPGSKAPPRRRAKATPARAPNEDITIATGLGAVATPYLIERQGTPETTDSLPLPYDEDLLERARTQWQFGDWASLAKLERETLQHHPDRAKLALLAAGGHLQTSNTVAARQFVRLAQDWGCSRRLVTQILVAGVHNSLGRATSLLGNRSRSLEHFSASVALGAGGGDMHLLTDARFSHQIRSLGLDAEDSGPSPSDRTMLEKTLVDYRKEILRLRTLVSEMREKPQLPEKQPARAGSAYNLADQNNRDWLERARIAGALVMEIKGRCRGAPKVADIGCGDQKLERVLYELDPGITYQGFDLLPQSSSVIRFDVTIDDLPDGFDVAILLGVIEYVSNVDLLFQRLQPKTPYIIVSHVLDDGHTYSPARLKELGWVTHLTREALAEHCQSAGFQVAKSVSTPDGKTLVLLATSRMPVPGPDG